MVFNNTWGAFLRQPQPGDPIACCSKCGKELPKRVYNPERKTYCGNCAVKLVLWLDALKLKQKVWEEAYK